MSLRNILLYPFTKLSGEVKVFNTYPADMRTLLITNMIYAFVLPVIDIFAGAYIMFNLIADVISIATNPRLLHPK